MGNVNVGIGIGIRMDAMNGIEQQRCGVRRLLTRYAAHHDRHLAYALFHLRGIVVALAYGEVRT